MGSDGSQPQLVPGTDEIGASDPTWSPDGTALAFDGGERDVPSDATLEIYTAALDGSGLTNITQTPNANEVWPDWSWTEGRIAFTRSVSTDGLFTIAPDGTDERQVTDGIDVRPSWSPDGTSIVFQREAEGVSNVWTVQADGPDLRMRTEEGGYSPAWQPIPLGSQTSTPEPSETPSATPVTGEAERLPGVPFPVCRPLWILGNFGAGEGGRAFIFEEERVPGAGCVDSEGFQRIGIAPDGTTITSLSERLLECLDSSGCWPFATPDIDGDGIDEIAIGIGWVPDLSSVALYRVGAPMDATTGDPRPRRIAVLCEEGGSAASCRELSSVFEWGRWGERVAGAYCGRISVRESAGGPGFVVWVSTDGDGFDFVEYDIRGGELVEAYRGLVTHGLPDVIGLSDESLLCDDPVFSLRDLDPELAARLEKILGP